MTTHQSAATLAAQLDALESWEDRYRLLLDLGRALPPLPEDAKTEPNRVHGCQSNVWLVARTEGDRVHFLAASDAAIVQGLIGILHRVYDGRTREDVLSFDAAAFFTRLGFDQHLSRGRRNGLAGMVQRIKDVATPSAL